MSNIQQYKTVESMIDKMMPQIMNTLPKHIKKDRLVGLWLNEVRKNPKLGQCTAISLANAMMLSAQLGLEPGPLQQCYFIPFKNKKNNTLDVEFQIGYKGYIELAKRSGQLKDIDVIAVYEIDYFHCEYGYNKKLEHRVGFGERGKLLGFYCYTESNDGAKSFTLMSLQEIEKHRDRYSKSRDFNTKAITGPWADSFIPMAQKTVCKQHFKYKPLNAEFQQMISNDGIILDQNGNAFNVDELQDVTPSKKALKRPTNDDHNSEGDSITNDENDQNNRDFEAEYSALFKIMTDKDWEALLIKLDGVSFADTTNENCPITPEFYLQAMKDVVEKKK